MVTRGMQFNSNDEIVCKYCNSNTVVCLDRCSVHQCTTCRKPQHNTTAPYGTEDVMSPRSRWQYGMGIGNRSGKEAITYMNDTYMYPRRGDL